MNDKSILHQISDAPRVQLKGSEAGTPSDERYQIVGEIARGGVGVVYKGRDSDLGRDVAMKLLREDHLARPEMVQRFVEEAQIGGQLQHPGIVPVYELGMKEGKQPYFAMKLVKGRTLTELLRERKDPGDNRRGLLAQFHLVCQTVAYAHSRGVIHRDLKPSNIMVGGFGEVQVVDWGFAKVLQHGGIADERRAKRDTTVVATVRSATEGSESVAGSVMGTPAYMPPEQALGHVEDLTERADVFALGAILCEILTGAPPYTDDVFAAAAQARVEDAHARLDACRANSKLVALGKACLSALPKDRPNSAREVADVLGAYLAEAESRAHKARVRAAEEEAKSEEQRRARRQTFAIAASVLAVVLLGGGAWFWTNGRNAQREHERIAGYDAALLEAARLEEKDPAGARAAADRALGFAADDPARAAEATSVHARIRDRTLAAERAEQKKKDEAALLAKLDDILARPMTGDATRGPGYRAALPDLAALENFDRKVELAQHLDTWAAEDGDNWKAIDALARELDPDPWRNRLRAARPKGDMAALQALAAAPETAKQGPQSLVLLARSLMAKDRQAGLKVLRAGWERYPDDFWINYSLQEYSARWVHDGKGLGVYEGTKEDHRISLEHARICIALSPSAASYRILGHRLMNRDRTKAIVALKRAVELDSRIQDRKARDAALTRWKNDPLFAPIRDADNLPASAKQLWAYVDRKLNEK